MDEYVPKHGDFILNYDPKRDKFHAELIGHREVDGAVVEHILFPCLEDKNIWRLIQQCKGDVRFKNLLYITEPLVYKIYPSLVQTPPVLSAIEEEFYGERRTTGFLAALGMSSKE